MKQRLHVNSFIFLSLSVIFLIFLTGSYHACSKQENNIPDDFKYLMAIESNINPNARSAAGAAGLWQIMPATGKEFGLEINQYVSPL